MSTIVTDSNNVVSSYQGAGDLIRAEVGKFYSLNSNGVFSPTDFTNGKLELVHYEHITQNVQSSINPKKRSRIYLSGKESEFRSHNQWKDYLNSTILLNNDYLDHTFAMPRFEVESFFIKNFHHPSYEDATKTFGSNQLVNINLTSHTNRTEQVERISMIKTEFDLNNPSLDRVFSEFENRISNYTGSLSEISRKQRNIFDLRTLNSANSQKSDFPFYLEKEITLGGTDSELSDKLDNHLLLKNVFQTIKEDIYYSMRSFSVEGLDATLKITNLTNSILSSRIARFSEASDEIFLLEEMEQRDVGPSGRFVNNIRATAFLADYRDLIQNSMRNIEEIHNCTSSKRYLLGYKIEKYLDRDVGTPIQTYYIKDTNLIDTQLKYGREYIYKTKALIAILGTSHKYTNLVISQNDIDMVNSQSLVVENNPAGFSQISGEKYKAYFDVEVTPSFQIVEYEIENRSHAFVDEPLLFPHVHFYHNSKMPVVNFILSPNMFKIDRGSLAGPTSTESQVRELIPLLESDIRISELLRFSEQQIDYEYFYGEYEIYKMDFPPQNRGDFSGYFLDNIDTETRFFFNNQNTPENSYEFSERDHRAYYTDYLIPNKKYYYAFRALTYHGTPSNLTIPYEVELIKDSDEYKVMVREYKYPTYEETENSQKFRRLLRIVPNSERLIPAINENDHLDKIGEGDGPRLASLSDRQTFKIRIKSKHTGKSIDLNVSFRAIRRT